MHGKGFANYSGLAVGVSVLIACGGSSPRGQGDGAGGDSTPGDSLSCPMGLVDCGSGCVDLGSDPLNCGACGVVCDARVTGATGRCTLQGADTLCVVDTCDPGLVQLNDFVCSVPPDTSCISCTGDPDCLGGSCVPLDGQDVCALPCDTSTCPLGYTCGDVGGNMVCLPDTLSCVCESSTDGATRACFTQNAVGTCFGTETCDGSSGWQACTAPAAVVEVCDGLDNDCNGVVDDGLTPPGSACESTNSFGTCTETWACRDDGSGVDWQCDARDPEAEVCDGADNNCDGAVDEPWLDSVSGLYTSDEACGSCSINCTTIFALPNATGQCDTAGSPQCVFNCDSGTFDLNGVVSDGCEFVLDMDAIYVSAVGGDTGSGCGRGPVGTGAGNRPCSTISAGLLESIGRSKLLIANGAYNETVTLISGVSLLGGFRPDTWERDITTTQTTVFGTGTLSSHTVVMIAAAITEATVVEGLVLEGQNAISPGTNSYGIYVSSSGSGLEFRNNIIRTGTGAPGVSRTPASDGLPGVNGSGRVEGGSVAYDAFVTTGAGFCNASNNRNYSNGGSRVCGADNVSGGNGGGNNCPTSSTGGELSATDGQGGQAGAGVGGGAGSGGDAGNDGSLDTTTCFLPAAPTTGAPGEDGEAGGNAGAPAGCSTAQGMINGGHWVGGGGGDGSSGDPGGGGGGGGAGGGGFCQLGCTQDRLGAHGGGGGSGGCGGSGGQGATAGGASIGIVVMGGSAPTITGNTIERSAGGAGGQGGRGGVGGVGGEGGDGGECPGSCLCYDSAGDGGTGGSGGHGSGGGGGCGGAVYGILTSGIGSPTYCDPGAMNTISGGAAGIAGVGGLSLGNSGGDGVSGEVADCSFR